MKKKKSTAGREQTRPVKKPTRKNNSETTGLPSIPTIGMDDGGGAGGTGSGNDTKENESKRRRPENVALATAGPPTATPRRKSGDSDDPSGIMRRSVRGRRKVDDELDDVFSFYTWTASRQSESKIMKERRVLREAIMDGGPLHRAYKRIA